MPLQNRVSPFGRVFRSNARGTFMGNRGGALHNAEREIVRQYKSRQWIICLLEFKGRHRSVMSPGLYTELFFLDEAVALAAGHRPCAECRRERFNSYRAAWMVWASPYRNRPPFAPEIDEQLHRARIAGRGTKVTYRAPLDSLPEGTFVQIGNSAYLLWNGMLLLWSPAGYTQKHQRTGNSDVEVLTPQPNVGCLRHGYVPEIHDSHLAL